MKRRAAGAAAVLGLLAACAAIPGSGEPAPRRIDPVSGAPAGVDDLRVGELSPRELASGECGLFLWQRTEDPALVFFFNSTTGRAAVVVDGAERALRRLEVTSSATGAAYGEQLFATAGGELSVRVAVHEREELPDGVRIPRATVRVADDRGWSVVIGAGGLAACQP